MASRTEVVAGERSIPDTSSDLRYLSPSTDLDGAGYRI